MDADPAMPLRRSRNSPSSSHSLTDVTGGRGQQRGRYRSRPSPWVLVLHADATLQPHAIDCHNATTRPPTNHRRRTGSALYGQPIELLPIEILNDLRLFTRTAFGDQAQFFHRTTALDYQLMPEQPLMEDIEASWRIRESNMPS